jgi:ribosomal protein S18 acetylase RimI-like enzyme
MLSGPPELRIRILVAADALRYRELMLEAYVLAADAFTSTADERSLETEAWWVERIAAANGLRVAFCAEDGSQMLGTVALEYASSPKVRHSAALIGMYVREHARGRGVGRALVDAALADAAQRPGVEVLRLTVTEGNQPAIHLYQQAGFRAWGTQPMAIATPSGYKRKVHMSCTLAGRSAGSGKPRDDVQARFEPDPGAQR